MQYTIGLATNVSVKFISVSNVTVPGGDEFAGYLLDTATYMLGLENPPPVMSTSYGADEEMVSPKLAQYVLRTCDIGSPNAWPHPQEALFIVCGSRSARCICAVRFRRRWRLWNPLPRRDVYNVHTDLPWGMPLVSDRLCLSPTIQLIS